MPTLIWLRNLVHDWVILVIATSLSTSLDVALNQRERRSSRGRESQQGAPTMITELIKDDSPLCLTRAITRTMIGACYTPLSSGSEGCSPKIATEDTLAVGI